MKKGFNSRGVYNYHNINCIRTKLLLEIEKDLNRHIKETQTKINNRSLKEFEKKYHDFVINVKEEYFTNQNNEIYHGKKKDTKYSAEICTNEKNSQNNEMRKPENIFEIPVEMLFNFNSKEVVFEPLNLEDKNIIYNDFLFKEFGEKDSRRFNISDRKNKKFKEYILSMKNNLNTSDCEINRKEKSKDISKNEYLNEEKIKREDLIEQIYSQRNYKSSRILKRNSINNDKCSQKNNPVKRNSIGFFNTLNNADSFYRDISLPSNREKEKAIEKFISQIPNKNNNKFIIKLKVNNRLLFRNREQMRKAENFNKRKISLNFLHILTMKLKKIEFPPMKEKTQKIAKRKNSLFSNIKNLEINEIRDSIEKIKPIKELPFVRNYIDNSKNDMKFSEKLLDIINHNSTKNTDSIENEIIKGYPNICGNSSNNLKNLCAIMNKKEHSNKNIKKFISSQNIVNYNRLFSPHFKKLNDIIVNENLLVYDKNLENKEDSFNNSDNLKEYFNKKNAFEKDKDYYSYEIKREGFKDDENDDLIHSRKKLKDYYKLGRINKGNNLFKCDLNNFYALMKEYNSNNIYSQEKYIIANEGCKITSSHDPQKFLNNHKNFGYDETNKLYMYLNKNDLNNVDDNYTNHFEKEKLIKPHNKNFSEDFLSQKMKIEKLNNILENKNNVFENDYTFKINLIPISESSEFSILSSDITSESYED